MGSCIRVYPDTESAFRAEAPAFEVISVSDLSVSVVINCQVAITYAYSLALVP